MKHIIDLPYNTLTVYLAPYIFSHMRYAMINDEFRLATNVDFFDKNGYLNKDLSVKQILSHLYFITELKSMYLFTIANNYADISLITDNHVVFKINTFRLNFDTYEIVDIHKVISLRTSALSKNAKKLIQQFWKNANKLTVLAKLMDELYPTDDVKYRMSKELGIDYKILLKITDLTQAIKKNTDSVEGILYQIEKKYKKKTRIK